VTYAALTYGCLSTPRFRPTAIRYIAPTAKGSGNGSSWENAGTLASLNTFAAALPPGGEIWLRADAGNYIQDTTRTLTNGNVVIRGVDVAGNNKMAVLVGSRMVDTAGTHKWDAKADTAAGVYGKEVFRLNAGCDNMTFMFIEFRNQGRGCIRARQAISNLIVSHCDAINVAAFITNDAASGAGVPTVTGLTVDNINVKGFSKFGVKLETGDSNNILIEDFYIDGERQDNDNFASGIVFDGTAHDIIIRRGTIRNIIDSKNVYQNGDGIAGEKRNHSILVQDVLLEYITDGGVDFKGDNIVLERVTSRYCHRNFRLWGYCIMKDCVGIEPGDNAGFNKYAKANISVFDFGMVRIIGGRFEQDLTTSAVIRVEKGGMASLSPSTVIVSKGPTSYVEPVTGNNPPGAFINMNPSDFSPPIITSSLELSQNENKFGIHSITSNKPAQLRIVGGPAAKYFATYGTQLRLAARDFEKPPIEAPDNIYRVDIQMMDGNGNLSAIRRVNLTLGNVDDDPITPSELVTQYGVTKGAWSQVSPATCWQDIARTIPAETDTKVALIDDQFGFGTYAYQDDPDKQAYMRQLGGVYFLEMNGEERYAIGAPGYFNFPQATGVFMLRRESVETSLQVVFANPRNIAIDTRTNYAWGFGVDGGQNYYVYVSGSSYTPGSSSGLAGGVDKVASMQTAPTTGRANGIQTLNATDHPTITYGASIQAILGGHHDGTKNFVGRLYGWVITNNTLDADTTLFRVERQLADGAGLNLAT
jgi:hypothetical protein